MLGLTLLQEKQVYQLLQAASPNRHELLKAAEAEICKSTQLSNESWRETVPVCLSNGCDLQCQHGLRQLLMLEVRWVL